MIQRTREFFEGKLLIVGQVSGYGSWVLSWLTHTKEFFATAGIICGGALSIWALFDKARKEYRAWVLRRHRRVKKK